MLRKVKITICLGSSCFARGNQQMIARIQKYIKVRQLEDKVEFKGDHCSGNCSEGPNLFIGTRLFQKISSENIEKILDTGLAEYIKQ
ncbi:MAG: (2Fe-2S) ferredoxin domain-containing protein [Bacteroidales bacterium]|nr:(2Fe-2S) ferredoxin domain-containing protein [Bacteroidales bacterium]